MGVFSVFYSFRSVALGGLSFCVHLDVSLGSDIYRDGLDVRALIN